MKILFLSDLLSYGGASKLIYDLLPRMKQMGNICELLILTDKNSKYIDELRAMRIKVSVVPENVKGHVGRISYIKKYIDNGGFDIIHAHLFPTIYYCSVIKRIRGKKSPPIVMTEHSTNNRRRNKPYLRPLEQFMYKPYAHIISISNKTQDNLCEWLRIKDANRFSVIENGIDIPFFRDAAPMNRKALYPDHREDTIFLLTVGRFEVQKNHEGLIRAFTRLPEKYVLLLCGEGSLQEQMKDLARELNVYDRIVFLGYRSDVARIMHTADIMVIPSIWEGFGLIAAEAMACGIPLVVSDVPGLREVVGDAGVKFNPNHVNEIAEAIIVLSDEQSRLELIQAGNKKVYQYDINKMVDEYIRVYMKLLLERGRNL